MEVNQRYWAKKRGSRDCAHVQSLRVSLSAAMWSMLAVYARGPGSIPHIVSLNVTFLLNGHTGAIPQLSGRIILELCVYI